MIDDEGEDGAHGEGVSGGSDNVSELDIELLIVMLDPTSGNKSRVDTVETDDVVGGEKSIGHET